MITEKQIKSLLDTCSDSEIYTDIRDGALISILANSEYSLSQILKLKMTEKLINHNGTLEDNPYINKWKAILPNSEKQFVFVRLTKNENSTNTVLAVSSVRYLISNRCKLAGIDEQTSVLDFKKYRIKTLLDQGINPVQLKEKFNYKDLRGIISVFEGK